MHTVGRARFKSSNNRVLSSSWSIAVTRTRVRSSTTQEYELHDHTTS